MKIYISADMEGISGIAHWDETESGHSSYKVFQEQMIEEVKAACEGALAAGAKEVFLQDAHDTARNIIPAKLPEPIKLVRGWAGNPFFMVQGIDQSFDALLLVGYHSGAGFDGNPLCHTLNPEILHSIKINDILATEALIFSFAAAYHNVPTVFVSGDSKLCAHVTDQINKNITTVATNTCNGDSVTTNMHPAVVAKEIRRKSEIALRGEFSKCSIKLPASFKLEICFKEHQFAYRASYYPGMEKLDSRTVLLKTSDYLNVLRALLFLT